MFLLRFLVKRGNKIHSARHPKCTQNTNTHKMIVKGLFLYGDKTHYLQVVPMSIRSYHWHILLCTNFLCTFSIQHYITQVNLSLRRLEFFCFQGYWVLSISLILWILHSFISWKVESTISWDLSFKRRVNKSDFEESISLLAFTDRVRF